MINQIQVNVVMSKELEKRLHESLDKLDLSSQQAFAALEKMASGLEAYARIQTILLGVLVGVCVLVLAILLIRDRQLRALVGAAWHRIKAWRSP